MKFDNTYVNLPQAFYAKSKAEKFAQPKLLIFNHNLAKDLGLNLFDYSDDELALIFSGQSLLEGSELISQVYAAHQFGQFVPRLGDGRALLLGEVLDPNGQRFDIQLKGSGQTDYSRNGDGKSSLGPVIREFLVSEAMFHLGVPTTRALSAVSTGEKVYREEALPGGVFCRVAKSHIRIGTFQYFAARNDLENLKTLLDYSVSRHYPEILEDLSEPKAILFLRRVIDAQVKLIALWQSFGFIHGVMNTDNTSISGETIDYGPCAFMDRFNYGQVYSFIDKGGRYAYMNQGPIIQWNLSRLADCLIPLVDANKGKAIDLLNQELSTIEYLYKKQWLTRMSAKLGLKMDPSTLDLNAKLIQQWLDYLQKEQLDFTLSFRNLPLTLIHHMSRFFPSRGDSQQFYRNWLQQISSQGQSQKALIAAMNHVNPAIIPRNHQIERAIHNALHGDLSLFKALHQALKTPFAQEMEGREFYKAPLPEEEIEHTFCGT